MPRLTIPEIEALSTKHFPEETRPWTITSLGERDLTLRLAFRSDFLRLGGTISGPAMMALADTAAYFLSMAHAGPYPNMATVNLDIHFLSRPDPVDVIATARLLRLGRRLVVTAIEIRSEGSDAVVAHATVTYAIPSTP
jgi:uncharacterized protein (TIGR00369 family)